jgi:hypothetical protein
MPDLLRNESARAANQDVTVRVEAVSPRRGFSFRGLMGTVAAGAVAMVAVLVAGVLAGVISLPNPFATDSVDRSTPALLDRVSNLSSYAAARGHFQQTVDVEDDVAILPSFLAGQRTTFLANGTVDATVNFSKLGTGAVVRNTDSSVTLTLPRPALATAVIDPNTSRVVGRDRGVIDRIAGIFDDTPTGEQRYYVLAQHKIDAAARHSQLVARAERNTTKMLQGFLGSLGYADVHVVFAAPTGPAAA